MSGLKKVLLMLFLLLAAITFAADKALIWEVTKTGQPGENLSGGLNPSRAGGLVSAGFRV